MIVQYHLMVACVDEAGTTAHAHLSYDRQRERYSVHISICMGVRETFRTIGKLSPIDDEGEPARYHIADVARQEAESVLERLAAGADPAQIAGWRWTPQEQSVEVVW